jgi:hypothetical protein
VAVIVTAVWQGHGIRCWNARRPQTMKPVQFLMVWIGVLSVTGLWLMLILVTGRCGQKLWLVVGTRCVDDEMMQRELWRRVGESVARFLGHDRGVV